MKPLYDTLIQLHADLQANIPALLYANDLADFSVYKIGGSRNAKETGLFVYRDMTGAEIDNESRTIMLQLQLYNIEELTAAKYEDIVYEYMRDYDPENIGLDLLSKMEIDSYPMDQTSTTFVFFHITWSSELDSCDNL